MGELAFKNSLINTFCQIRLRRTCGVLRSAMRAPAFSRRSHLASHSRSVVYIHIYIYIYIYIYTYIHMYKYIVIYGYIFLNIYIYDVYIHIYISGARQTSGIPQRDARRHELALAEIHLKTPINLHMRAGDRLRVGWLSGFSRGTTRAEDAQGTPTRSHTPLAEIHLPEEVVSSVSHDLVASKLFYRKSHQLPYEGGQAVRIHLSQ